MVGYLAMMSFTQIRVLTGSLITLNWTTKNMIDPKLYMVISENRYWKAYQIV
jgi:hypothetical protein